MNTDVIISFMAEDRPGLLNQLADTVKQKQGSWLESRLAHLAGKFTGIIRVSIPKEYQDDLVQALQGLSNLSIMVNRSSSVMKIGYSLPYILGRWFIIWATIKKTCIRNKFWVSYYCAKHFACCSIFLYYKSLSYIYLH